MFWGSWGSEVPRLTLTPHLPDELNPLLDSLTPLVTCSKVGTFDMRPMDKQSMVPQTQVAIHDVSQIVDPQGRVTVGLHPL